MFLEIGHIWKSSSLPTASGCTLHYIFGKYFLNCKKANHMTQTFLTWLKVVYSYSWTSNKPNWRHNCPNAWIITIPQEEGIFISFKKLFRLLHCSDDPLQRSYLLKILSGLWNFKGADLIGIHSTNGQSRSGVDWCDWHSSTNVLQLPTAVTSYILCICLSKLTVPAFDTQVSYYSNLGFDNLERIYEMILSGMGLS